MTGSVTVKPFDQKHIAVPHHQGCGIRYIDAAVCGKPEIGVFNPAGVPRFILPPEFGDPPAALMHGRRFGLSAPQ
jgi:hypothetical protein